MNRLILLALLLACSTTQASDWVSLGKVDQGKEEVFVDISNIEVTGTIRRAWVKTIRAPEPRISGRFAGKEYSSNVGQAAYDCEAGKYRLEKLAVYWDDEINKQTVPPEELSPDWNPIPPYTVLATEFRFACAWKPK